MGGEHTERRFLALSRVVIEKDVIFCQSVFVVRFVSLTSRDTKSDPAALLVQSDNVGGPLLNVSIPVIADGASNPATSFAPCTMVCSEGKNLISSSVICFRIDGVPCSSVVS